jgi:hypothetical protein
MGPLNRTTPLTDEPGWGGGGSFATAISSDSMTMITMANFVRLHLITASFFLLKGLDFITLTLSQIQKCPRQITRVV